MSKVLVTGGSGYIGSHTMIDLIDHGFEPVCVDNFSNSFPDAIQAVEKITGKSIQFYNCDLTEEESVKSIFEKESDIEGIIHFAALKAVGESIEKPILYFKNNIQSLLNVVEEAIQQGIGNFIFSSSCTVYGNVEELPVTEETEMKEAESPYGRTKQIGEWMLKDLSARSDMSVLSLRYFNPAGAHESALLGEASKVKALNLVPVITETAIGKRTKTIVFGNDYETRDGSCIRDYIHVMDLANAHTRALRYLIEKKNFKRYEVFNLGIGNGISVLEAIHAFEKTSGKKLNYEIGPRRNGDVVAIYADYQKAQEKLGWAPKFGIEEIMKSAWEWEKNRPF